MAAPQTLAQNLRLRLQTTNKTKQEQGKSQQAGSGSQRRNIKVFEFDTCLAVLGRFHQKEESSDVTQTKNTVTTW